MNSSNDYQSSKKIRNLIRISLLLIILPVIYLGLWISISGNDDLTYAGQVQKLMSYFPEALRNPYGITLTFFGLSFLSAVFGIYAYLKSSSKKGKALTLVISAAAALVTMWFGITLL